MTSPNPNLTYDDYVRNLRVSRLVDDDALTQAIAAHAAKSPAVPSIEDFGQFLIERQLLTLWQHRRLAVGYARGFFLGQYKLLRRLGAGGMGSVYLAEHTEMRRLAALKVVSAEQVSHLAIERFRRESQIVAALDHPHIVRAHDYNRDGKYHFLVMEYLEGVDLDRYVKKRGPLSPRRAADLIGKAASGLHYAHTMGVVHRDVKPSNLMVDRKGQFKILDLGLARIDQRNHAELTSSNAGVLGTVDFIAPEQAMDGHNADARADVYSLGCTLYFLLVGQAPFPEGTIAQRLMCHVSRAPTAIKTFRPDVPDDLVEICDRMMAKKPEDRFQTAEEVRLALKLHLAEAGFKPDPRVDASEPTPTDGWTTHLSASLSRAPSDSDADDTINGIRHSTLPAPTPVSPSATPAAPIDGFVARPGLDSSRALGLSAESLSPQPDDWSRLANARPPVAPARDSSGSSLDLHADSLGLSAEDLADPSHSSASSIALPASSVPGGWWRSSANADPGATSGWGSISSDGSPAARAPRDPGSSDPSRPRDSSDSLGDDLFRTLPTGGSSMSSVSDFPSRPRPRSGSASNEPSSLSLTRPPAAGLSVSSMMIQIVCSHCRARLAVAGNAAREGLTCPKCGHPTR